MQNVGKIFHSLSALRSHKSQPVRKKLFGQNHPLFDELLQINFCDSQKKKLSKKLNKTLFGPLFRVLEIASLFWCYEN